MATARWSSRAGFLLASVGAAVGLGNIWRFPAVLGQNGGGAYLVPYLLAAVLVAIPLLVLEFAIGRRLRTDVVSAFRSVGPSFTPLGWIVVGGVLLVLSYYLVLTGWVLGFAIDWLRGTPASFTAFTDSWLPVGYFVLATALTGTVVSAGVRDGIERLTRLIMPLVFVLLLGLAAYGLTLPSWGRAASFLFTPELSVLGDPGLWTAAVGQVFFSLSVGQGIMLTYGAYIDDVTDITGSAVIITVADVAAALLAGLVIFPIVFAGGGEPALGTELAFTTLPAAFAALPFGRVLAVAFFGLLFFAALSSAVALLEVGVAAATTTTRLSRRQATAGLTVGVFSAGVPAALSYSPVDLAVAGQPVLDLVDASVGTYALPISALLIAIVFGWRADLDGLAAELGRLWPLVRYLVPVTLVVVLAAQVLGVARPAWRFLLAARPDSSLALLIEFIVLLVLLAIGWTLRDRIPIPRRR